jgi:hypothetical protein
MKKPALLRLAALAPAAIAALAPAAIAALAPAAAALALAGPAAADPVNKNTVEVTLDCGAAGTFTGRSILQNSALPFAIEGSTMQAVAQEISFADETGATVVVRDNPGKGLDARLVTCTYNYPGFPFLVTGRFLLTGRS